jgi:hypothetical protein
MTGALLQNARGLAAAIATSGGFTVTATLSTPDNATTLQVTGLGTGTWMVFEDQRQNKPVNSRSNSFDIPEAQLIAAGYPYKNANGRIDLRRHNVIVTDNAGLQGTFTITEDHYNATFGLVVVILGIAV